MAIIWSRAQRVFYLITKLKSQELKLGRRECKLCRTMIWHWSLKNWGLGVKFWLSPTDPHISHYSSLLWVEAREADRASLGSVVRVPTESTHQVHQFLFSIRLPKAQLQRSDSYHWWQFWISSGNDLKVKWSTVLFARMQFARHQSAAINCNMTLFFLLLLSFFSEIRKLNKFHYFLGSQRQWRIPTSLLSSERQRPRWQYQSLLRLPGSPHSLTSISLFLKNKNNLFLTMYEIMCSLLDLAVWKSFKGLLFFWFGSSARLLAAKPLQIAPGFLNTATG